MPEVLQVIPLDTPPEDPQIEIVKQPDGNLSKQNKTRPVYDNTEFTFHPRVSTASTRIVKNLGVDFLERQKRHVERQRIFFDENQNVLPEDQTPKRLKMNLNLKQRISSSRPNTSDRSLLKKRSKSNKNDMKRQASVAPEAMDTNLVRTRGTSPTPSPPILLPRAKTYCSSVSQQSVGVSGVYGSPSARKRSVVDPYANFDRLQRAKAIVEKAIKHKKIFSIHGSYPLIRKALRDRGWVEKEFKLPLKMKTSNRPGGDWSDADDDDDDDDDNDSNQKDSGLGTSPRPSFDSSENDESEVADCYGIMGRMVRNEVPTLQWTTRTSSIDWRFLQKDQIVNHFAKANFTTKVGLCMNLRMVACFSEGHSDFFFPRCYRLSNEEDKLDFIDDFRLTAASGILKIVISRHMEDHTGNDIDKIKNGQLPPPNGSHIVPASIIKFAIKVCRMYEEEREHEDIDKDESLLHVPDQNWDDLILHYTKLVHEGATIAQSASYFAQCEEALNVIKDHNPQFFIEGCKNTWIVKPGAKSRGRGIIVMNRLDDILKLVSGDPTLIKDSRWVIQKYIERPLLVYGTKFDVRQWFLVSDWNPVTVWIYKESYLRFSSRPFNLKNLDPCIHLCNYSVQKNFDSDPSRHPSLPADNMWSDTDFRDYLRGRDCHTLWNDKIYPGMKQAIVHICQTAQDIVEFRKNSFELYGADFMIDENYNPWLIEVNSSPTMARSTSVTSKLCASVQEDTLKVILDRKRDKNCDIGLFELVYKQSTVDVPLYVGKALNVEGTPIKKPVTHMRRVSTNPMSNSQVANKDTTHVTNRGDSNETTSVFSKSLQRATSIYNKNVYSKKSSNVRSSLTSGNPLSPNHSKPSRSETVRTPVRIKMQNTMSRLNTEANNTPNKPNAFSLPKCSAHSSLSNPSEHKSYSRVQSKLNCNIYSVRLSASENTKVNAGSNSTGHFVSSSQAKAASTMGIMNFGSAYSSVVAAANRGCLNTKFAQPHPPPQPVVPKTFPISAVAGGEVVAGGNTMFHPPSPHGLVALSPQNIGLGLPFHKYYNMEQQQGKHRRGGSYVVQDPRYGIDYSRISGIYEWVCKQQNESGFSIYSYYEPRDVVNQFTNTSSIDDEVATLVEMTSLKTCKGNESRDYDLNQTGINMNSFDIAMQESNGAVHSICNPPCMQHHPTATPCPFSSKLTGKSHKHPNQTSGAKDRPRWEKYENDQKPRRNQTTETFRGKVKQAPKPLPILQLFSLSHRYKRSLTKCRHRDLTISCPTN